jgi:hypothetical protein
MAKLLSALTLGFVILFISSTGADAADANSTDLGFSDTSSYTIKGILLDEQHVITIFVFLGISIIISICYICLLLCHYNKLYGSSVDAAELGNPAAIENAKKGFEYSRFY